MTQFFNHLWQSTLFAGVAGILAILLRRNSAGVRHWIWLAASVEFLVPFGLLVGLGGSLAWLKPAGPGAGAVSLAIEEFGQPFGAVVTTVVAQPTNDLGARLAWLLPAVWICGVLIVTSCWVTRWRRMRKTVKLSSPLRFESPCPVVSSPGLLEPGVFGIWRPILLLPEGIADRLTSGEFEAIFAHEMCHLRRRDNLAAAVHMAVEAIFWFHPLVWWIGARLLNERERACDEEVIRQGNAPGIYAESILKVCQFYLASPLECASGVSGSNLKKRIEDIMAQGVVRKLDFTRKLLLAAFGVAAVAGPTIIGLVAAPQSPSQAGDERKLAFDAASIRPNLTDTGKKPGGPPISTSPGRLTMRNVSLSMCLMWAYNLKDYQVSGPSWLETDRYDIVATAAGPAPDDDLRLMLRTLLADRFHMALHRDKKDLASYTLVVGKNGPKLRPGDEKVRKSLRPLGGSLVFENYSMADFAVVLSRPMGRPVLDMTGLKGVYDYTLRLADDDTSAGDLKRGLGEGQFATSLVTFIQELGLKLEARKAPVEVLVVDRAERVPTEN